MQAASSSGAIKKFQQSIKKSLQYPLFLAYNKKSGVTPYEIRYK